jgi:hypothetical protein
MVKTLTLYFCEPNLGAPSIDFVFRMRSYGHFDGDATTLGQLRALRWRAEKKYGNVKIELGTSLGLPEGGTWDLFGAKRRPLMLKVSERHHFSVHGVTDELNRITVDMSRMQYKVTGDRLEFMGDMGPRVEVKLPRGMQDDHLPLASELRKASHWHDYSALTNYMWFILARMFPAESHIPLPEVEVKYNVISDSSPQQVFDKLLAIVLSRPQHWRLVLPYPHIIIRTRRNHVCEELRPGCSATIVETPSGRCSLKIKADAHSQGSALLRTTQASYTTHINGTILTPDEFAQEHGLNKINEFTKLQRKIPISLANNDGYQLTVDACSDLHGQSLVQLEIEYMGNTEGKLPPTSQVVQEVQDIGRTLLESPLGAHLALSHVSKHAFFATQATAAPKKKEPGCSISPKHPVTAKL